MGTRAPADPSMTAQFTKGLGLQTEWEEPAHTLGPGRDELDVFPARSSLPILLYGHKNKFHHMLKLIANICC